MSLPAPLRRRSIFLFLCLLITRLSAPAQVFTDDTFEDFSAGKLDGAGQNIYVSRDGAVRTIHRFDFNQDGFIDLLFNNTHDRRSFVPAGVASFTAGRELREVSVAVEGSRQTAVADLNRDGYVDLVFCPNDSGVQNPRRFLTLAYGGPDGWPPQRVTGLLPVHGASKVVIVDLNDDQWPDIIALNSPAWLTDQPSGGPIIRTFWGSESGFLLTRRRDIQIKTAIDLTTADLDQDGIGDLAILMAEQRVIILWGGQPKGINGSFSRGYLNLPGPAATAIAATDATGDGLPDIVVATADGPAYVFRRDGGRGTSTAQIVSAFPASHLSVGDLDGDRRPELVFTDFRQNRAAGGEASGALSGTPSRAGEKAAASVHVLWGSDIWDHTRSTAIDIPFATATAIGDLDDDGQADLAVAVHQNTDTYSAGSAILLGKGGREFTAVSGPSTEGATHVAIAPKENGHPPRAIFANSLGGTVGERIDSQLFWGSEAGFSENNQWTFKMRSGYEHSAADLNNDGFVDLIVINSGHAGAAAHDDPTLGANIFWGAAEGFDPDTRRTVLNEPDLGSTNIADLNRDGYLDITLGAFDPERPLVVYYGSAEGYATERRSEIPSPGRSIEGVIADFNGDDWLDIAVASFTAHRVRLFWGGPQGFADTRQAQVEAPSPIGLEAADLNADGRLDLIVASYQDPLEKHHDTGMQIFWGSDDGFQSANAQWLPGFTPISPVVADFDADGFLDIFAPHYHSDLTRELLPNYIYWGSAQGFAPRRRAALICDSAHDGLAADFDRDGKLDLAVSCHTSDGDHATHSKVFYNDGNRFASPNIQGLLTHGTHWMQSQDMGHIAHRRWEQTYESAVFTWPNTASQALLRYEADTPAGSQLLFELRAAPDREQLALAPWQALDGSTFALGAPDRVLQYRARFRSPNGDRYPVLHRVEVEVK